MDKLLFEVFDLNLDAFDAFDFEVFDDLEEIGDFDVGEFEEGDKVESCEFDVGDFEEGDKVESCEFSETVSCCFIFSFFTSLLLPFLLELVLETIFNQFQFNVNILE